MFLTLVLIWSVVALFVYNYSRWRLITLGAKLPGPLSLPFVGNALIFLGKPENIFKKYTLLNRKYPRLLALWLGPKLFINIFNAKDAEMVIKAKGTIKADEYRFLRPWLGESILISEGSKFKKNKKMLTSAFHSTNLRQYLKVFSQQSKEMVEELSEKADGTEFDVLPYLSLSTMFALLETSMGVKKETLGIRTKEYIGAVEKLGRYAQIRSYTLWLHPYLFFKYSALKEKQDKYLHVVHTLTERVIKERRKEYVADKLNQNDGAKKWPIFLDKFFEAKDEDDGSTFTDDEIKDEVMTMLFAGHDTTSVSIGFCLCLLGLYQDVQERLYAEIMKQCPEDREINYEDCKDMAYMDQVIQESWRLFPPIPIIAKKPTSDINVENHVLPKNSTVILAIFAIHRDPDQYPNPFAFDPDNFHPDRIKERNPCSFIPFSAGQRTCIGQRYAHLLIKVALTHILKKFKVSSTIPMNKYRLASQTSLKRKDGFLISLKPRK